MMGYDDGSSSDGADSSETMRCPHGLELCSACCVDYTELNQIARDSAACSGEQKQVDVENHVPLGTRCKLIDRSERVPPEDLIGIVVGSRMAVDDVMDETVPHYVIESAKDGERLKYRIDDFHEEWLVWQDGEWVQPAPLHS